MGNHTHVHHHYHGGDPATSAKFSELLCGQARLEKLMSAHSDALAALTATANKLADDETLTEQETSRMESQLTDLKAKLDSTDPDDTPQIVALNAQIQALDDRLVALTAGASAITDPPAPAPAPAAPAPVDASVDAPAVDASLDPAGNPIAPIAPVGDH